MHQNAGAFSFLSKHIFATYQNPKTHKHKRNGTRRQSVTVSVTIEMWRAEGRKPKPETLTQYQQQPNTT